MIEIAIVALLFAYVQFRERLFIPVPFLESEMPLLEIPLILAAGCLGLYRFSFTVLAFRNGVAVSWMPYLVLGAVLPVLGINFMGYSITSLYISFGTFFLPLSALIIGAAALPDQQQKRRQVIHWLLNIGLLVQLGLSIIQFMRVMGYSNPLVALVTDWDISSQARFKEEYIIVGRSIGSYISPNVLGVWALGAFYWNLIQGKGVPRVLFCGLSVLTLLLSQSRGSAVAFLVSLAIYLLKASLRDRATGEGVKAVVITSFLTLIAVIAMAFVFPDFSMLPGLERWQGGFSVVTQGTEADANLTGRIQVWKEALGFMREYPFGTLGPPQILFILPADNHYVHLLLQGSVPLVLSFFIGLMASIGLMLRQSKEALLVAVFAVAIATNSVTALPLFYPPGLLFWFFLGIYLNSELSLKLLHAAGPRIKPAAPATVHEIQDLPGNSIPSGAQAGAHGPSQ